MMEENDKNSQKMDEEGSLEEADLMSISQEAMQGTKDAQTLRLQGTVQSQAVVMLVDSGSSRCFISEGFSRMLIGEQRSIKPVQVWVANGQILEYVTEFSLSVGDSGPHFLYYLPSITFTLLWYHLGN